MSKTLTELRGEIDHIDSELVRLFEARLNLAADISKAKHAAGLPVFDPAREQQVLASRVEQTENPAYAAAIRSLFRQLMELNKAEQRKGEAFTPSAVKIDFASSGVLYSGIPGAYAQQAAVQLGFAEQNTITCGGFDEALSSLSNGRAAFAILPVENSIAGPVVQSLDVAMKYRMHIVAETCLRIDHCLVGLPGSKIENITLVISHEQALRQCADFCRQYDWQQQPYYNTAAAAAFVAKENDKSVAAIASADAARIYNLEILAADIGGNETNTTRFWLFSNLDEQPERFNKISLCFTLPHQIGSLFNALSLIAKAGYNMTSLQSRPIPYCNWQYRFFTDIEGDFDLASANNFCEEFGRSCQSWQIMGFYNSGGGLA